MTLGSVTIIILPYSYYIQLTHIKKNIAPTKTNGSFGNM